MSGLLWRLLLILCVCLGSRQALALNGAEVAQLLNQAWSSTPDHCVGEHPAYYCSGVMLKQVAPDDPAPFWSHGPEAIERGAERFDYLRRDIASGPLTQASGYIFADRFTAIGQGKDYQLLGDDGMDRPPELLVRNWEDLPPGQLPVLAVYHDAARHTALAQALVKQRAWFQATGEWLPVLQMQTDEGGQLSFSFDLDQQLYLGYQVADRLNQRFRDTSATCADGSAAYNCNGVLIRGVSSERPSSWNPFPDAIADNGVSFSYHRADLGIHRTMYGTGFIFHELQVPVSNPVTLRCAYAGDGLTGSPDRCKPDCSLKGIHTLEDYRRFYPDGEFATDCSLGAEPQPFHLNNEVRHGVANDVWNEVIIAPWPLDIPERLPLEAFWQNVVTETPGPAQFIQRDYMQATGRFLPFVWVDLSATAEQVYRYDPLDQAFQ